MKCFVLDCSVTMGWCFEDEKSDECDRILEDLKTEKVKGVVPSLWHLEVVNVLQVAEKKGRIQFSRSLLFLDFLSELSFQVDEMPYNTKNLLMISNTYGLSAYDSVYMDLAVRMQIPLATFDKKIRSVAYLAGVTLYDEDVFSSEKIGLRNK